MACLSSRVAFGERITPELLARIDRAEREVRALGFSTVRVRHFGGGASIEVDRDEVGRLRSHSGLPSVLTRLAAMGWSRVEVAGEGYRAGRMNTTLTLTPVLPRTAAGSGSGPPG
jgi:uncharacterized protein